MKRTSQSPTPAAVEGALADLLDRIGPTQAFDTLARLLPDAAVFVVDADRNVVLWSEGAERVLGFPATEVVGRVCLSGIRCRNCMIGCGVSEHETIDAHPLDLFRNDGLLVSTKKYARGFFSDTGEFLGAIEVLVPTGAAFAPEPHEVALPPEAEVFQGLTSRDPAMKRAFQIIRNVAETDTTVLVRGESGTGKELVARALHAESHRREGPLVAVNCAALTPSLIESELFGHEKGAFTGAASTRDGLFAQADTGTLFLDEVAELPLDVQAKLLRVLEERVFTRVGASTATSVDIRVIAATHRALRQEVKRGRFREDLMYRLRVVPIFLPPLRERPGDVELLLRRFLDEFNGRGPRHASSIAPDAMRALLDHSWPGNVRELRNVVEYAFAVGRGSELLLEELPPELRERTAEKAVTGPAAVAPASVGAEEATRILTALEAAGGNIGEAATMLGMSRPTLWRKRKKLGI